MTERPPHQSHDFRAALEWRFDGPIPAHLLETCATRQHRHFGAHNLIAAMTASYHRELWRQLAQTRTAFESAAAPMAAFYRGRLEATARNLASLVVHTDVGKKID